MSSNYHGLRVMDPLDPPNVPQDIRRFVDSGPIPRFATYGDLTSTVPAIPGSVAAVGESLYRVNASGKWVLVDPIQQFSIGGANVGSSPSSTHELNRQTLPIAGIWYVQALISWDSGMAQTAFDGYLGVGEPLVWYLNMAWWNFGHTSWVLSGILYVPGPTTIASWVVHQGGGATTFRADISAILLIAA